MRRTAYPIYRPSSVEWLGEVPEHWEVGRLGTALSETVAGGTPSTADEAYWADEDEEGIPWVAIADMSAGGEVETTAKRITPLGLAVTRLRPLSPGTIIYSMYASVGAVARLNITATTNQAILGLVPTKSLDSSFMYWWLTGVRTPVLAMTRDNTQSNLNAETVRKIPLALPPVDEQQAIAAFLDSETTKVDALVAKNQQLIERLAEYRTALITRTVTNGLPPDVAQAKGFDASPRHKPAGPEWLGDVPEHWGVVENRHLFRERDERSDDGEGELLTVSHITGVTRRSEKPEVGMFMAESLEDYKRCYRGDFVINTMWAWMGAAGMAKEPGLVSPSYNVYVPDHRRLLPRFVDLAYRSSRYVLGMTSESRGIWSSRLRLYPQHFLSLVTAVPPLGEQEAIIEHIDSVEMRIERLSEMVCTAIERLQEYRSALITAAVTGKIDVRDYAAVEAAGSAA